MYALPRREECVGWARPGGSANSTNKDEAKGTVPASKIGMTHILLEKTGFRSMEADEGTKRNLDLGVQQRASSSEENMQSRGLKAGGGMRSRENCYVVSRNLLW